MQGTIAVHLIIAVYHLLKHWSLFGIDAAASPTLASLFFVVTLLFSLSSVDPLLYFLSFLKQPDDARSTHTYNKLLQTTYSLRCYSGPGQR